MDDIESKIESLRRDTLSEWDLDMYSRHGYDNTDESADPYSSIVPMIEVHRLQRFLCEAVPTFSRDEKATLLRQGQDVIHRLGVWMPGPVADLDTLCEAICS